MAIHAKTYSDRAPEPALDRAPPGNLSNRIPASDSDRSKTPTLLTTLGKGNRAVDCPQVPDAVFLRLPNFWN